MGYEIKFNRDECIGCGACTSSDNWEMADDGKATPKVTKLEEVGDNQEIADSCPAEVISIVEN